MSNRDRAGQVYQTPDNKPAVAGQVVTVQTPSGQQQGRMIGGIVHTDKK